jgi:hypothetical protein
MLVTLHVAAIATLIRYLNNSRGRDASLIVWVPITIAIATLVSWPISRVLAPSFGRGDRELDRTCPRCRRIELRPMIRPGEGIFALTPIYQCPACRVVVRIEGQSKVVEPPRSINLRADPSGIEFLDEPATQAEIRFLDDPAN